MSVPARMAILKYTPASMSCATQIQVGLLCQSISLHAVDWRSWRDWLVGTLMDSQHLNQKFLLHLPFFDATDVLSDWLWHFKNMLTFRWLDLVGKALYRQLINNNWCWSTRQKYWNPKFLHSLGGIQTNETFFSIHGRAQRSGGGPDNQIIWNPVSTLISGEVVGVRHVNNEHAKQCSFL